MNDLHSPVPTETQAPDPVGWERQPVGSHAPLPRMSLPPFILAPAAPATPPQPSRPAFFAPVPPQPNPGTIPQPQQQAAGPSASWPSWVTGQAPSSTQQQDSPYMQQQQPQYSVSPPASTPFWAQFWNSFSLSPPPPPPPPLSQPSYYGWPGFGSTVPQIPSYWYPSNPSFGNAPQIPSSGGSWYSSSADTSYNSYRPSPTLYNTYNPGGAANSAPYTLPASSTSTLYSSPRYDWSWLRARRGNGTERPIALGPPNTPQDMLTEEP